VEPAQRVENCEVRILEVGHPNQIADAIKGDVLHLSSHGLPGALENEAGLVVRTMAAGLLDRLRATGRPLPLVGSCHGGVPAEQTASFAEALPCGGIPADLAMQTHRSATPARSPSQRAFTKA
jgi:hypothetical protein